MGGTIKKQISNLLRSHKKHQQMIAILLCLATIVTLGTVAVLKLPGEAMTHQVKVLDCHFDGTAAHTHNDDCYDENGVLVCPLAEHPLHVHTDACYTTESYLACGLSESAGHQHTSACYSSVRGALVCGMEESEEHSHSDSCYEWHDELTCGMSEGQGAHTHTDACYATTSTLSCGQDAYTVEHVHSAECFTTVELSGEEVAALNNDPTPAAEDSGAAAEPAAQSGAEPAAEPAAETAEELEVVDMTGAEDAEIEDAFEDTDDVEAEEAAESEETGEPEQAEATEAEHGDPNADVETSADWQRMFANLKLTGNWDEDLIAVAKTQIGYTESTANYIVNEAGKHKGYTRYGDWYGYAYGDWCAMFVSFCLNYADIPADAMPREASCPRWVEKLDEWGMYASADSYDPKVGDLIFFTKDGVSAAHVGIVYDVYQNDAGAWIIQTIEGNSADSVRSVKYDYHDWHILGYGILPENPESPAAILAAEMPAMEFEAWADDVKVYVYAPVGAFPEGTAMSIAPVYEEEVIEAISGAVEGEVKSVQAVDITFTYNDEEIEPQVPVQVVLTTDAVAENENTTVVHVDSDGAASAIDSSVTDADVAFEADAFSVYAIVGVEPIVANLLTADGSTLTVSVIYDENEEIPEDAELMVSELSEGDVGWGMRSVRLAAALSENYGNVTISDARMLEIRLLVDGEEYEFVYPVKVTIKYTNVLITEDMAEYDYDEEYGGELRPDPEEQVSHFAAIVYTEEGAVILPAETKSGEDGIVSSTTVVDGLSDCDLVYVYEYETVSAD